MAMGIEHFLKIQETLPARAADIIDNMAAKITKGARTLGLSRLWANVTGQGLMSHMNKIEKQFDISIPKEIKDKLLAE